MAVLQIQHKILAIYFMDLSEEGFQNRDELREVRARAVMNPHFHMELLTQVPNNINSASGVFIYDLYEIQNKNTTYKNIQRHGTKDT